MRVNQQTRAWRFAAVCCVFLAQGLAWAQEPSSTTKQMLKHELAAAGQLKLDSATRARLLAVIRELNATYSEWEERNGQDFRRLMEESKKGAMSDSTKAVQLMVEYQKIKEEIKVRIDKELSPVQQTEFYAAVNALKAKEAQRQASEGVTASGMSPRQAVKALGLPSERAGIVNAVIAAHEEKVGQATKKRAEMQSDGQKQLRSAFPEERARGTATLEKAKKLAIPTPSDLDAQIIEALPMEFREGYKKLRLSGTDKERLDSAKLIIGRMRDGEFNMLCDVVFALADLGKPEQEPGQSGRAALEALVIGLKPQGYVYTRAMRMSLMELPGGTQIVERAQPVVSAAQNREIADAIKTMIEEFRSVPTDKEKREALGLGLSKAVNVLSVEQRVWVVSQAEK